MKYLSFKERKRSARSHLELIDCLLANHGFTKPRVEFRVQESLSHLESLLLGEEATDPADPCTLPSARLFLPPSRSQKGLFRGVKIA